MKNLKVTKIIENLNNRRPYEEIRAAKLGFTSLYEYIENKVLQKQFVVENSEKLKNEIASNESQTKSKSCNCC